MKKLKDLLPKNLNEIFLMRITDIDDIYPRLPARNFQEEMKRYKIEMQLYKFLNDFWKRNNIPRRLKEPKMPERVEKPKPNPTLPFGEPVDYKYAKLKKVEPKNKFLRNLGF